MSILIKGMEMPKNCHNCELSTKVGLSYDIGYCCQPLAEMIENNFERKSNCPLVPVPPHGRLIDADALKAHYSWWAGGTEEHTLDEMKSLLDTIIDLQPTITDGEEDHNE